MYARYLGAYIISATMKSTVCIHAMMRATNGGATARNLNNRGYSNIDFFCIRHVAPPFVAQVTTSSTASNYNALVIVIKNGCLHGF